LIGNSLCCQKGNDKVPNASEEVRRALLEKYLRGDIPGVALTAGVSALHTEAEMAGRRERAVVVQAGKGSRRPFFFLHGDWNGSAFFCFPLARELGPEQPFYSLEPYQFDSLRVAPTLETMAAAHVESMRAIQPEGPYLLGGWCNGGLVAYEMARQLHAAGQTVDLLVLMDAMYLGYRARRILIRKVINRLGDLMGLGPDKQLDWFLRLLYVCKPLSLMRYPRHLYNRLRYARRARSQDSARLSIGELIGLARRKAVGSIKGLARMFGPGRWRAALFPTAEALRQDYLGIIEWVDMCYVPPDLYPGKITFFWPRESPWHTVSAGWRKVVKAKGAQEVEAYVVPGRQETWRTEHLHELAEHLRMCLGKVQKEVT
jgi:hypothetical protein